MPSPRLRRPVLTAVALVALASPTLAACSDDPDTTAGADEPIAVAEGGEAAEGDAGTPRPVAPVQTITAADAMVLLAEEPDVQIIDVRTPEEVAEGYVAGATNLDLSGGVFEAQLGSLDPDATYLLYCRSGNRSAQAAQLMVDAGFTDVYDMGAFADWQAAGGEVATG